jgi:serine/threonine protein kinase
MQQEQVLVQQSEEPILQEQEVKGKVEKKSGKRVGYNYIIVKSYKESQKNDVVKCLYIKSLTHFGFCVIKEGTYGDTKDKQGRDIIDRLKWQRQLHEELQDKIHMPRLLGHFEERGNYYLVIGHIRGKALTKLCAEKRRTLRASIIKGDKSGMQFLNYLVQIAGLLESLHGQQIVHRDATPNNYMITPRGKVALIDMEMCYSVAQQYPTPAFQLGTYGYMSPQQEATKTPTTAEDIFALGAIILQVWSGIAPGKLTNEPPEVLRKKVEFLIPDRQIAEMVMQCLLMDDQERPDASSIRKILLQYKTDLQRAVSRPVNTITHFPKQDILATLQQAASTLASPLLADEEKGWFADDMRPAPGDDKHKLRKAWYASYNRGVTGIIYCLAQYKKAGLDIEATKSHIAKGLDLVKEKYIDRIGESAPGLHFGSDGIAAILATAIRQQLVEPSVEYLDWIDQLLQINNSRSDVLHGVAGSGIANLICRSYIGQQAVSERLHRYADLLIAQQQNDGSWANGHYRQKFTRRKKKKITRGFAEGMAGIICFLLEFSDSYQHQPSLIAAKKGLRWLIKKAKTKNGEVYWLSARNKELNYSWSDGNAGIALSFIRAYRHTGEEIYRQYATKALRNIPAFVTDNNISQYNGLCGLGEVYLEAYQVFNENEWLERADWIAQLIMHLKKEHPQHGPYWLVDHDRQPVANFMVGNSGVLHFLLRYCYPEKIGFPLLAG